MQSIFSLSQSTAAAAKRAHAGNQLPCFLSHTYRRYPYIVFYLEHLKTGHILSKVDKIASLVEKMYEQPAPHRCIQLNADRLLILQGSGLDTIGGLMS